MLKRLTTKAVNKEFRDFQERTAQIANCRSACRSSCAGYPDWQVDIYNSIRI